jgi:quercetin dioxygenase-like cupin family protein
VDTSETSPADGLVLTEDEGQAFWFLNTLTITKVGELDTKGGLAILDHRCPAGYAPPPHIHRGADEAFYILEGQFEGFCGESSWAAGPGTLVFLPRDVPHGFRVSDTGPGRTLLILAPAGFDRFVVEIGEPAREMVLPEPTPPDPVRIVEIAAAHGIHVLPPPGADPAPVVGAEPKEREMNVTTFDPWIVEFFRTIDSMDAARLAEAFTEDGTFRFGNSDPAVGRQQVAQSLSGFFSMLGGLSHELTGMWSGRWESGEVKSVEAEVTYTRKGGTRTPPLPVTSTIRMQGDRIKDYRVFMDVSPLFTDQH